MLKAVQEGSLEIYLKSNTILKAGQLVKIDLANPGYVIPVNVGETPFGILGQDVVDPTVNNFKLDSVTQVAYSGGKVGIYFNGGQYYTDQTASAITYGALLYSGANGLLTTTASGNAVGQALGSGNAGDTILYRSLIQ